MKLITEELKKGIMKWKVLESEYLHKEPWLTIRKDKCEMPDGTVIPSFYVQEYPVQKIIQPLNHTMKMIGFVLLMYNMFL